MFFPSLFPSVVAPDPSPPGAVEFEGKQGRGAVVSRQPNAVQEGVSRAMFGTDHPFFPPLSGANEPWESVLANLRAIETAEGWSDADREGVRGTNAVRLFGLDL